ncbi:MAG: LamG-like jellyroll fold domain-containing protein, partial [Chloroflexota bacterium]|nr:LamG-like jellyroll fold domain-containing protein [Chloroflexota bacterium]
ANGLHWWTGCRDGGPAGFSLRDTDGNLATLTGITDLTDGLWHHIVAVRDADEDEIRIYVDGTAEDSESTTYSAGFASLTAAVNVGHLLGGYHFDGVVDEVALYERALPSDEVRQHYNEGLAERWYCQSGAYAPIIVSPPVTAATVGRPYLYDVEAAGDPAPTYALVVSPTGMTIDTLTGLISWTPMIAQEGNHNVQVQASNSEGTDTQNFTIIVQEGTLCPADMIAYWKLDETSDDSAYDDFYDGHDGECAGDCPTPVAGHVNGGQAFSSTTGIDVPADAAFNWGSNDSFSIEFWMQTDSASTCTGNQVIVGRDDSANGLHWWTGCRDGGPAGFSLGDTSGYLVMLTGITDLTDGFWHHIVAVRDADEDEIRIYVDGTEEDSEPATYSAGFSSLAAAVNIGWLNLLGGFHFDGTVDEVALYDRALAEDEVQQHYNDGEAGPGYCINPDIAVNKTADPPVAYVSDTVIYTYTVTNPGDDPLGVSLTDDRCGPVTFTEGDDDSDDKLDPTEAWVYACSMTLTTDITNVATVTGAHSLGGTVNHTDTVSVNVISPAIALDKVADPTLIYAGDTVIYTYTVTNPGDDPLSVATPNDDQCEPVSFVGGDGNLNYKLDPGETWAYTCSTIVSADITNTATVTGTDSAGGTVSVADTAFVDVINPAITISKTPDSQMVRYDSMATFTIAVTNTGDAALTNVTVSDDLAPDCGQTVGTLEAGEYHTYTCTVANVTADFTNSATVIGTDPLNGTVIITDTAFVDVISPAITIAKTPDSQMVRHNSTATFTIAITNTGDAVLTNVNILDTLAPNCEQTVSTLAAGTNLTYSCTVANVTADFTNSATAIGTPPVGPDVSDTDTASVDVINPDIAIAKTPDAQTVRSDSMVTFTIAVTNTGDTALENVTVSDPLVPNCEQTVSTLAVGENHTYPCAVANVTADFTNSATATGTPPVGPDVSDTDTALVDVINPDVAIAKTPDAQTVRSGSTVTFTIAVTNTGDAALTNVTVSDGLAPNCGKAVGLLTAEDSLAYTCTITDVTADFLNSATVTGTPPVGPDVSDTDTAFVDVINPYIEIAKMPDTQTTIGGSTVTFSIVVTNTSDVTLTSVSISDPLAPDCEQTLDEMIAGDSHTYVCTRANVMADFINIATVTATPPVGPEVSDTDIASVYVINPDIQIAKTPDSQMVRYNSTATFTIAITNTSDAPLSNVTVSDILAPNCTQTVGTLAA